ncbi:thymidylate synthase [Sporosarcina globispora]|uniref:thymidylate synthase n=1 Tax=Sporosarcina globispora TaxID=1459 RepID=A0A0M0GC62_SPOGL|nr:thymidylate synthase [Sporosarcina globispora]KON87480.1 thymidylate synthase [Sporosarcina globispora]
MNKADKYFLDNLKKIKQEGVNDFSGEVRPKYKDGSPAHTKYITFVHEEYDLSKGEFPIPTLRPVAVKSAIGEVLAFYQDQTNDIGIMKDKHKLHWWKDWEVRDTNTIGIRYGATVKRYDLLNNLLDLLNNDMFSRRKIMSLWQEQDFKDDPEGLKPCFYMTNWEVRVIENEVYLDLHLTSRSSDYSVAGAINRTQYVALQMMIANHFGFKLGKFSVFTSNLHYYDRHEDQVEELLSRTPSKKQPYLKLNVSEKTNFYDIKVSDFELVDFECKYPQLDFELGI